MLKEMRNVAFWGTATQSSIDYGATAVRAIDGNNNADAKQSSCSHTKSSKNPWWRVDLKANHFVSKVIITTRKDCCRERILGAEVHIGNSLENHGNSNHLCGIVHSVSTNNTFDCEGFTGRYVNIILPGRDKILEICEVEVFAIRDLTQAGAENVALWGTATQSSTDYGATAVRAIDGNNNADGKQSSCSHTKISENPWWRVDLKTSHFVSKVRITTRKDCCRERILGAEVHIGNSLENHGNSNQFCGMIRSIDRNTTFDCDGFTGRYLNIVLQGYNKILELCEVEVFATGERKYPSSLALNTVALVQALNQPDLLESIPLPNLSLRHCFSLG
ncbi:pentraxin fusion protein-like [Narcine bancroftii]|uniref:pentraxin fusion protein-like n=1 Tax=Narcine bancroftii TaxID=1343680 RepID=UPI003831CE1B